MTKMSLRTYVLFPDEGTIYVAHSHVRSWSPILELYTGIGLKWCGPCIVHSPYMHTTAILLQCSQKKRK